MATNIFEDILGREIRRRPIPLTEQAQQGEGVPGTYTEQGTFIPGLGELYAQQDAGGAPQTPSVGRRREWAGRALAESTRTEELLRYFSVKVPKLGEEEITTGPLRYLKWPLFALKQLQRGQFAVVGGLEGMLEGDIPEAFSNFYRGLVFAEEHEFGDILEKYGLTREEHPYLNFTFGLAGDIVLDPISWATFGTWGTAKGALAGLSKGAKAGLKMDDLRPWLSEEGTKIMDEMFRVTKSEAVTSKYVVDQVSQSTKVGKRLMPHGVRAAHWVPRIGGTKITDMVGVGARGKTAKDLMPGGVIQYLDDIEGTNTIMDRITESMIASEPVKWFGKAFVPHWELRRKYPLLVELERTLKSGEHESARQIYEKVRQLAKVVDTEADQKLLTEILEDPSKLIGRKFVTVKKTVKGEAEAFINMDYFIDTMKIGEHEADEIVDFFLETYNTLKPGSLAAPPLRRVPIGEYKVGEGARGTVVGGDKFKVLEPLFQALAAAHPNSKAYKLNFGDFVVKIPAPDYMITGEFKGQVRRWSEFNPLQMDVFLKDMAAEIQAATKLSGSGVVPSTSVVWRHAREIIPELSGSKLGMQTIKFDDLSKVVQHKVGDQTYNVTQDHIAWAMAQGGWEMGGKKGTQLEFISWLKENPMAIEDFPIPILVKKFVKGDTVDKHIKDLLEKAIVNYDNRTNVDEFLDGIVSVADRFSKLAYQVSRTGVIMGDAHTQNFMVGATGPMQWVDTAFWDDYIRGVRGSGGAEYGSFGGAKRIPTEVFYDPRIKQVTTTEAATRAGEGEFITALPGVGGFEKKAPPMTAARRGKKFKQVKDVEGNVVADDATIDEFMKHARGTALADNMRAGILADDGVVDRAIDALDTLLSNMELPDRMPTLIKFLQKLKDKKVIRQYGIGKSKLKGIPENIQDAADAGFLTTRHTTGGFTYDLAWAKDSKKIVEPISKSIGPKVPRRDWIEQAEVIAERHPEILNASPERMNKILAGYEMATEWRNEIVRKLEQRGLVDVDKINKIKIKYGIDYLPRYRKSKSVYAFMDSLKKSIKNRKTQGIDVRKHELAIRELNEELGTELYEDNIINILAKYDMDASLFTEADELVTEAVKIWGKPAKMVGKFVNKFDDQGKILDPVIEYMPEAEDGFALVKNYKGLENIQMPEEVVKSISKFTRTFNDPTSGKFWQSYDKILGVWKGYATFVNPGFHGRNFFSNLFQLYLKDGPDALNPKLHKAAVNIMRGKEGKFVLDDGTEVANEIVMDKMRRHGVYGTGWFGQDIKEAGDVGAIARAKHPGHLLNPADPQNIAFRAGRYVGGWVENEARVVGFLSDFKRTGNEVWSAENTKKFLFDYDELTDFERKVMKRIFPFYTWMRKNIALQAEQIVKQPAKYANIERVKSNLEAQAPTVDERWIPKYFPELYAVRTPLKTKKGSPLYLNPNLPFQDLQRIFDPQDWLSSLGPWKALFELASNKNFFTMNEIQKYEGEVVEAEWLSRLPTPLLNKVGPMIGATKVFDKETTRWYWGINPKAKYAIEQAIPTFRNIGKYFPRKESEVPHYRQEKRPYDIMSAYFGVKLIPYNIPEQVERKIFKRRDVLRDIKRTAQRRGVVPSYYLPEGGTEPPKGH